jgi:hypothetical protein
MENKNSIRRQSTGRKKIKKIKADKPTRVHIAGLKGGQRIKAIESEPVAIVNPIETTDETKRLSALAPGAKNTRNKSEN